MQSDVSQNPSDLFRQAVIELAALPDAYLVPVMELVNELKRQGVRPHLSAQAQEIRSRAHQQARDLSQRPREEVIQRFNAALEGIRATAIANGTAIDGDWHGD